MSKPTSSRDMGRFWKPFVSQTQFASSLSESYLYEKGRLDSKRKEEKKKELLSIEELIKTTIPSFYGSFEKIFARWKDTPIPFSRSPFLATNEVLSVLRDLSSVPGSIKLKLILQLEDMREKFIKSERKYMELADNAARHFYP